MITFREFAISGKVLIIEKRDGLNEVLAHGWYKRQQTIEHAGPEGGRSTYTWKNHLEWFQKRKGETIIWLMRRANRALKYDGFLEAAKKYLFLVGKQAKAVDELLERGQNSLRAKEIGTKARNALINRCLHARKYKLVVDEAFHFLRNVARNHIAQWIKRLEFLEEQEIKLEKERKKKPVQANYRKF